MYSSVSDSHLGICQLERANKQGILMYSYLIGGCLICWFFCNCYMSRRWKCAFCDPGVSAKKNKSTHFGKVWHRNVIIPRTVGSKIIVKLKCQIKRDYKRTSWLLSKVRYTGFVPSGKAALLIFSGPCISYFFTCRISYCNMDTFLHQCDKYS